MKRYAVTPYSLAQMQKRVGPIENTIMDLISSLDKYAVNGKDCNLGNLLHYFAFDVSHRSRCNEGSTNRYEVLGEVAFSKRFGFLEQELDVEGSIKNIDDVQWYDGIVGQIPEFDALLRNNPLRPYLPFGKPQPTTMTRIAIEELEKRKQPNGSYDSTGIDLLAELLRAHDGNKDKFSLDDVFSIAHGAM